MITLYTGRPGSGKSLDVVYDIKGAIFRGKTVVSNVMINRLGLPGRGRTIYLSRGVLTPRNIIDSVAPNYPYKEGRYLLVIDECQLIFNARSWQKNSAEGWVEFFTQHRKIGFDIILITQYDTMIDKQIRQCVEYEVEHRRASRFGLIGWVVSLLCGDFLRIKRWYGQKEIISRSFYRGGKRLYNLYDTSAIF